MKVIFIAAVALLCVVTGARGKSYDNRDYGIHVALPNNRTVCVTAPPGSNHGFVILLNASDCSHAMDAVRIELLVSSNTPSESETVSKLAQYVCDGRPSRPTDMKLAGLRLRGCATTPYKNLWLDTYFTLRPIRGKWVGLWPVYEIALYCEMKDRARYTEYLRQLVSGIRLTRPW
jgi:hypothetical protein